MADIIIKHCFQSVSFNFNFANNKGEKLLNSGHVFNVQEVKSIIGYSNITGYCIRQTSVTNDLWKITLDFEVSMYLF